ncbi:hypothetical protein NQZ68_025603 [Dissostichus eleginoides]|nr:hypothetical protein NQZ68_025603 [Dissostichus eleginoides]
MAAHHPVRHPDQKAGIRQVFFIRVVSSSVPSKLSSISRMKAARGREGVCLHPPPADVLPAPGIQQTPTNRKVMKPL